jgi:biopolymer transport protein ExbB
MTMTSKFLGSFATTAPGYQFMYVILFFGIIGMAITIERGIFIYVSSNIHASRFMGKIKELINKDNYDRAIELCRSAGNRALPLVVGAAIKEAKSGEFVDFRAVQNAVDEATLEIIPKLNIRTGYLAAIGNIATLTGLMGTIFGLILSFEAAGQAGGGAAELSAGIGVAMLTTLWGLVIAIPSIISYTLINTKANSIVDDIDEHSVKLIHLLTRGK